MPDLSFESRLTGYVCGVDEAGRGPCAGPLCVAAVILDYSNIPDMIRDSKKLTEKQRFMLEPLIKQTALTWSVVEVSCQQIEDLNIFQATMWGMTEAVKRLQMTADHALIDGNHAPKLTIPAHPIIKGDDKSLSIAAASILAKTARDRIMIEMDAIYPAYGFKKHKGYQAASHIEAIRMHGPSPIHRRTWSTLKVTISA